MNNMSLIKKKMFITINVKKYKTEMLKNYYYYPIFRPIPIIMDISQIIVD